MTSYPEPGLPRIRIKHTPTWGDPTEPAWVCHSILGEAGKQSLQIEESRLCRIRFKTDSEQPSQLPKKRRIHRQLLSDAQVRLLASLLREAQIPLPGLVMDGGYCDADMVELSISQFGLAAVYRWDGSPPEAWLALGKIVDFVTGLVDEDVQG